MLDRALYVKDYTPPSFANGLAVAVVDAKSTFTPTPVFAADSTSPLLFSFVCGLYLDTQAHIVLTWTDPPGNQASLMQLVNDLDLVVLTPNGQVDCFSHMCFCISWQLYRSFSPKPADFWQHDRFSRHAKQRRKGKLRSPICPKYLF